MDLDYVIDLDYIMSNDIGILIKSEEEYNLLCKILHGYNLSWFNGASYINYRHYAELCDSEGLFMIFPKGGTNIAMDFDRYEHIEMVVIYRNILIDEILSECI